MKKQLFSSLGLMVYLFFAFSCQKVNQQETSAKKPNIIIVITDDQGYGDMGHTGNTVIQTPTIDQFSKESINLSNYHVSTTCAPTRSALMTGRNPNRIGVWHTIMGASMLNRDEVTMADIFQENGYNTAMFGKWHLGDNHPFLPQDRGFDVAFYHGGGGIGQTPDYWNNDYFDDTYFRNGKPEKQEGYCTDVWFNEAIKFIEEKKDEPFLAYVSLNAPHGPYNVPEKYYEKYKDAEGLLETQKRFYGMISNVDDNFKTLLSKLDELEIADNTIVIFTTDNGTANGYKLNKKTKKYHGYNAQMRGTKASEYEGGHRVPFIIRWPNGNLTGGKELSDLTAHVDILPTLLTFAGIEHTPNKLMDGMDISDYLLKQTKTKERMLVVDTQRISWPKKGKQSCVMDGQWRLVNGDELYDLSKDPGQKENIASTHQERVQKMNDFYNNWWDTMIKETKYSIIDLGVDDIDVLTCHDVRTIDYYPPWNQKLIRQGKPMKPASFAVNFVKSGKYTFNLSRWPEESGLPLNAAIDDAIPATKYTDARVAGKAMSFKTAHIKVGEKEYSVDVDNSKSAVSIDADILQGNSDLTAWFTTDKGIKTNAFYIYVEHHSDKNL
ncbi:arylsulfatase [Flammeovirga agarivorans]|uniref:Arylsulfatase n=1 Tax=Flammeovirga agarivorans TaxID=2726742 RepID=A0A7X8XXV9_9BACT|nr:arylsulfatase [Flammeovirga agarivorans]NLR93634.1 arylsulfatase [Flammeovirga agarivorans]